MKTLFLKLILIFTIVTSGILFYVWTRIQVVKYSNLITENTKVEKQLVQKNKELKLKLAMLKSPKTLDIAKNQFNLKEPNRNQIVYMK